jgi:hypothetical protein
MMRDISSSTFFAFCASRQRAFGERCGATMSDEVWKE